MEQETRPTHNLTPAELMQAAEEVARDGTRRVVWVRGTSLAISVEEERGASPARRKRVQPFTLDDPLFSVMGIAEEAGPDDVARHKDAYLAEAYSRKNQ